MEQIAVIRGFRRFWCLRIIYWFAAREAEHLMTFLALLAENSSQVIDIHLESGLARG